MVAVRLAQFGGDDRIGTRTRGGRKAQVQRRPVLLVHLDEFQFFEHPHARLHLIGLRIGPLETLDELAGLGDHLLLVVVGRLLLLATLPAEFEVMGVVDLVVVDASAGDLDGARGDVVHESLVVGNDHYGLGVVHQEILQPLDRLDVEVVRRLVQEQQVGFLQQQLGQLDAHAPAAREFGGLAREVAPLEAQPQQNALHVFLVVGEVHGIELLGDGRDLLDQPHVRLAFVVGAGRELLVERRDPPLDFEQVFEGPRRLLDERAPVLHLKVLGQIPHFPAFAHGHAPPRGRTHSGDDLQQGRFARSVFAHQGDPVLVADREGDVFEKRRAAELYGEAVY